MGDSTTDKRDLKDRVADLRDWLGGGKQTIVAYRDLATGDLEDFDGNPIDPDDHGADNLLILDVSEVMEREKAEKGGREILGDYEGVPWGEISLRCSTHDRADSPRARGPSTYRIKKKI